MLLVCICFVTITICLRSVWCAYAVFLNFFCSVFYGHILPLYVGWLVVFLPGWLAGCEPGCEPEKAHVITISLLVGTCYWLAGCVVCWLVGCELGCGHMLVLFVGFDTIRGS
ncbi:uncharacterized protein A4U43_UnF2380 [Asparagus officinalis]|uniref:Uncharacterized protein n=1 Tax=Asparagus officinalis TaxID=4686 RepID=A0A1R3L797_ASPOF|nr:uncharacterized protein A4U43_UnF2380 [Asparagus officinalis]